MRSKLNKVRVAPLLSIVNMVAWYISGKFLVYEYRKRLSEGFLTHQLFWTLSFVVDAFLTFSNYDLYVSILYNNVFET